MLSSRQQIEWGPRSIYLRWWSLQGRGRCPFIPRTWWLGTNLVIFSYCDFLRYDKVFHRKLLMNFNSYCAITRPVAWFSFIWNQEYSLMNVNGILSRPRQITSGVIRESVPGPLLFLLYGTDIFQIISQECSACRGYKTVYDSPSLPHYCYR